MSDLNPNDYNGEPLVIVSIIFLCLTWLSVGLRCFVRVWIMKSFQWDDWFMLCAQGVFTLSCSEVLVGVHWGMGRHDDTLPIPERIEGLKWQTLATLTYVANMMFIKLSIAIFLLRIATQKRYTYTLKISMAIVTIWSLAIFFFDLFQCSPVQAQWDFTITDGKCASGNSFVAAAYSISVMTILTDWLYAIMPIPMIWSVQMSIQKKITVAFVLSLGIFASIATLIRVKYIIELGTYDDILFTGTIAMVWTIVEPGVAITAASLITIRPLLRALKIHGFGSSGNTTYGTNSHTHNLTANGLRSRGANASQLQRGDPEIQMSNWATLSGTSTVHASGQAPQKEGTRVKTTTTTVTTDGESDEEYILRASEDRETTSPQGIRRTRTTTVTVMVNPNGGKAPR